MGEKKNKPRSIKSVIDRIISIIPTDFNNSKNFIMDLEKIKESADYTAPESLFYRWQELCQILEYYLLKEEGEWTHTVKLIVNGEI